MTGEIVKGWGGQSSIPSKKKEANMEELARADLVRLQIPPILTVRTHGND